MLHVRDTQFSHKMGDENSKVRCVEEGDHLVIRNR